MGSARGAIQQEVRQIYIISYNEILRRKKITDGRVRPGDLQALASADTEIGDVCEESDAPAGR